MAPSRARDYALPRPPRAGVRVESALWPRYRMRIPKCASSLKTTDWVAAEPELSSCAGLFVSLGCLLGVIHRMSAEICPVSDVHFEDSVPGVMTASHQIHGLCFPGL